VDPAALRRLLLALAVSAALHLSLLYTVRVAPPARQAPGGVFHAQLKLNDAPSQPRIAAPRPRAIRNAGAGGDAGAGQAGPVEQPAAAAVPVGVAPPATGARELLPAVEIPLALDTTWYPARQLDVFPQASTTPQPAYPEQASAEGVRGEVTLLVLVDEAGAVHEVSVVEAQPEGYFEEAAVAAFQRARFEPARKDGRAVRSRILVKVSFNPDSND